MTVICDNCQAVNRDKAMFCRGCAGKLPAFVATVPAPLSMPSTARSTGAAGAGRNALQRGTGGIPRWWFASILLLGAAAAALVGWIALAPGQTVAAVATVATPVPAASAVADATVSSAVPFESALAPGESAIAVGPVSSPAVETAVDAAPLPGTAQAPAARATTAARAQVPRNAGYARADPRAGCEHLFFAFAARCEANHCAEAAYARHPRCEIVRAERQRDDARRNMTSGY